MVLILAHPIFQELYLFMPKKIDVNWPLIGANFEFYWEDWFWFWKVASIIPVLFAFYLAKEFQGLHKKVWNSGLILLVYYTLLDLSLVIPVITEEYSFGLALRSALATTPGIIIFGYYTKRILNDSEVKRLQNQLSSEEEKHFITQFKLEERERLMKKINSNVNQLSMNLAFQVTALNKIQTLDDVEQYQGVLQMYSKDIYKNLKEIKQRTNETIEI